MSASARLLSRTGMPANVWQADALAASAGRVVATGEAALDAQLPGGGWPLGALSEILQPQGVHNEWRLVLPAVARCGTGAVMLVGAPHIPFGPALAAQGLRPQRLLWVATQVAAQRLWATEQALRCADVDAVLAWLDQVRPEQLRRLHMAAAEYNKLLFVLRPERAQHESSPAVLRMWVAPSAVGATDMLDVRMLKRRGPPLDQALQVVARSAQLVLLLAAKDFGPHAPPLRGSLPPEGVNSPWGGPAENCGPHAASLSEPPPSKVANFPGGGDALDRTAACA